MRRHSVDLARAPDPEELEDLVGAEACSGCQRRAASKKEVLLPGGDYRHPHPAVQVLASKREKRGRQIDALLPRRDILTGGSYLFFSSS
jgi:hypothetical protein